MIKILLIGPLNVNSNKYLTVSFHIMLETYRGFKRMTELFTWKKKSNPKQKKASFFFHLSDLKEFNCSSLHFIIILLIVHLILFMVCFFLPV